MNSRVRPSARSASMASVAVRQHQGVVEHGRRRLEADVDLDGVAGGRLHRAERRRHEARHRAFAASADRRGPPATRRHTRPPRGSPLAASGCCRRRVVRTATAPATTETSGVTSRVRTFGIGAGSSRMPSPAATRFGEFALRRSSGPTPSAPEPPASARATARSGTR